MKNILTIISFMFFLVCIGMCIYDASQNNMLYVVWAVNAIINFINLNSLRE